MINSNVAEEIKVLTTLTTRSKPLKDRMDRTFGYFRGDLFEMPKEEGVWESITSNRAQSEGWKITNVLSGAMRSIFNEITDEKSDERDELNYNELLVAGMLYSAERMRDGSPETPFLQAEIALYRVIRGWGSYRLQMMEDDDGNPYLDLAVWDTRNVEYISGRNGLLKAYYTRMVSKDQVKDEYPGFNGKNDGMVKVVDIWDCMGSKKIAKEAVIAGTDFVLEPTVIKVGGQTIDYLPIRIKAGGGIPLIMDTREDNIKKVGEDYLVNNRDMLDAESRVMTYHVSAAGEEAGMPLILKWDSLTGKDMPPEWKNNMSNPRGKKAAFTVDVGAGQDITELPPRERGGRTQLALSMISDKLNTGGLHPVAYGEGGAGETAFGVDIRNHNTREHILPFQLAMQSDFVWIAQEITKQAKRGSFSDKQMQGYTPKFKWFDEKIKLEEVDEKAIFKCKLFIDELRDKATNAGLALQLVQGGLLPKREALDDFQISQDPDRTLEIMAQEQSDQMFDAPLVKGILAKIEDYAKTKDPLKKFELELAFRKLMMIQAQNQQAMSGGQPGAPTPKETAATRRTTARTPQPSFPQGGR